MEVGSTALLSVVNISTTEASFCEPLNFLVGHWPPMTSVATSWGTSLPKRSFLKGFTFLIGARRQPGGLVTLLPTPQLRLKKGRVGCAGHMSSVKDDEEQLSAPLGGKNFGRTSGRI